MAVTSIGVASCNGALSFSVDLRAAQSDSDFVWLPLQTYLYSATAAAVVQSRLFEACLVYVGLRRFMCDKHFM